MTYNIVYYKILLINNNHKLTTGLDSCKNSTNDFNTLCNNLLLNLLFIIIIKNNRIEKINEIFDIFDKTMKSLSYEKNAHCENTISLNIKMSNKMFSK